MYVNSFCFDANMNLVCDTPRNGEAYMNFRMARHFIHQLSTKSIFLRSRHVDRGSHAEKSGAPLFHKEPGNLALVL